MIQRYINIEEIKCGGFGSVWKVYDYWSQQTVAIKYLIKNTPENLRLFEREIKELWKDEILNNPHIINIIDHNLSTPNPYYVMEFCEGKSLAEESGKVSPQKAIIIMKSMIRALEPVHRNGGYHGDFKPDNILIAKNGNSQIFKLSDFGLAHTPNFGSTMTWTPRGTDPYKAPEVRQKLFYSSKADIYSFGITMFELLTGKPEIPYLFFSTGPKKLIDLLREMTAENLNFRPNLAQIENRLEEIEVDLKKEGLSGFFTSLSYPELLIGSGALAILFIGLLSNIENA